MLERPQHTTCETIIRGARAMLGFLLRSGYADTNEIAMGSNNESFAVKLTALG